jgi:hypothetical protein
MKACPDCGSTDLGTTEQLLGTAFCTVEDDGEVVHEGETEVSWDTSETIGGECQTCGAMWEGADWTDNLVPEKDGEDQADSGPSLANRPDLANP